MATVRGRGEVTVKREEGLKFFRPQTLCVVPVVNRTGVWVRALLSTTGYSVTGHFVPMVLLCIS